MRNQRSTRRVPAALAILTAALCATACGSSTAPGSLAGTYGLVSVNTKSLPVVLATTATDTITITLGTLTLTGNSYSFMGSYVDASAAGSLPFPRIDAGTWTVSGSTLTLTSSTDTAGTTTTATVNGGTLTAPAVRLGNDTTTYSLIFQKQ